MFGTVAKVILSCLLLAAAAGCKNEEQSIEQMKPEPEPAVIVRTKHPVLSAEQRSLLGFPEELIAKLELSAGAEAEPFFVRVIVPSESLNLKGERGFEKERLSGFSLRTKNADELISSYRAGLRVKNFIIFKSDKGYGSLPDIVSIVKGNNSYDILKLQATEAANYRTDTGAIIAWLKQQQKFGSFVVTGAGADWVEARFVKQPADMRTFARKILAFAPDVRHYGPQTADKLAERMRKINGFYLVWD